MKRVQVEVRVLEAVAALHTIGQIEDDFVECKQEWPAMSASRQLAGSANRAAGQPIIWIIGLDTEGATHSTEGIDPADWCARMTARFDDGVAPDLECHTIVAVSERESVVALQFATDRAPYVCKRDGGGSPEREVPMREGTRTRSAYRHELLRMLSAATRSPMAEILSADVWASWREQEVVSIPGQERPVLFRAQSTYSCRVSLYLEHLASAPVTLPSHRMKISLVSTTVGDERDLAVRVSVPNPTTISGPVLGVHPRNDGLTVTGSGSCTLTGSFETEADLRSEFSSAGWNVFVTLDAVGSMSPVKASCVAAKLPSPNDLDDEQDQIRWSFS